MVSRVFVFYFFSFQTRRRPQSSFFFFFNDTATTEIYTLSLHDASSDLIRLMWCLWSVPLQSRKTEPLPRSEEHTSELQSHLNLVCRLLLEKKKKTAYEQDGIRVQSATVYSR